jgi:TetR/AcrR family transcriptional regulator, lmrAB and yxaGH operons repressor
VASARVGDAELIDKISRVFRRHGYEGATMARLSAATGLEKASLYHRFPGGKDQMVAAAAAAGNAWFGEHVLQPSSQAGDAAAQVKVVCQRLREFYDDGRLPCVLESLSLPAGSKELHRALSSSLDGWLEAFARLARNSGFSPAAARDRAELAIIEIEGSLVLARVKDDSGPFLRTIRKLPKLLTEAAVVAHNAIR